MAWPAEAWKAASSVVAGENVLDSMASPQMATRGFWATPRLREASVPTSSRVLCMIHSSTVPAAFCRVMEAGRTFEVPTSADSTPDFQLAFRKTGLANVKARAAKLASRQANPLSGDEFENWLGGRDSPSERSDARRQGFVPEDVPMGVQGVAWRRHDQIQTSD